MFSQTREALHWQFDLVRGGAYANVPLWGAMVKRERERWYFSQEYRNFKAALHWLPSSTPSLSEIYPAVLSPCAKDRKLPVRWEWDLKRRTAKLWSLPTVKQSSSALSFRCDWWMSTFTWCIQMLSSCKWDKQTKALINNPWEDDKEEEMGPRELEVQYERMGMVWGRGC